MSKRVEKLKSILLSLTAQFFLEHAQTSDHPKAIITVTDIDISPDGKNAHVWVGLLHMSPDDFEKASSHFQRQLRKYIAQSGSLQYTPHIRLQIDTGVEASAHIQKLLED